MLLDLSVREQTYIEDCEVCCRSIHANAVYIPGILLRSAHSASLVGGCVKGWKCGRL